MRSESGMAIQQIKLANIILEQLIEYMDIDDAFLEQEGIFRKAGSEKKAREAYQKARTRPKSFRLNKMGEDFLADKHNIVGLFKKTLLDEKHPIKLNKSTVRYLENKQAFIEQGKLLDEAKFLHNLIYLSRQIVAHQDKNKMSPENVSIALLGSKLQKWLGKPTGRTAEEGILAELEKKEPSYFDKPFHDIYPAQVKKKKISRIKKARKTLVKKGKRIGTKINRKRKAVGDILTGAVKRRKKEPTPTAKWYDSESSEQSRYFSGELSLYA